MSNDNNVVNLDDHRAIEDVVKQRIGARHVVFAALHEDGTLHTYIPENVSDIWLCYMIQTLQDRRNARLQ